MRIRKSSLNRAINLSWNREEKQVDDEKKCGRERQPRREKESEKDNRSTGVKAIVTPKFQTRASELLFHKLDSMQNIIERPPGPAGNNLRPYLLWNCVTGIQKAPIGAGLRLDPLEVLNLTPAVFVVETIMVQGLEQ